MSKASLDQYPEFLDAMAELWQIRSPGPDDISRHPAFLRLLNACGQDRPDGKTFGLRFALSSALRSLGLPCGLDGDTAHPAMPVEEAAEALFDALSSTETRVVHVAPLDLADELPEMAFASAKVCKLTGNQLEKLFDGPLRKRLSPGQTPDIERFSEFHWLLVEETLPLDLNPGARALPFLSFDLSQDLGRIEPHKRRFPSAFNDVVFFMLLASWEDWATMSEVDWRGFRIPWVHTINSDIFSRPSLIPSASTLSWEPHIYDDGYGDVIEVERPVILQLNNTAKSGLQALNQMNWAKLEKARQSVLFETPIEHFLVRAFLTDGVDEFLAHITTIEAALGLQADYMKSARLTPDRYHKMSVTKKMAGRVAGLLRSRRHADEYKLLFDLRSSYIHGRAMTDISTEQRLLARSLARRVVTEIINATVSGPISSRESFLDGLLDEHKRLS